jgi:hypothetical protein
MLSFFLTFIEAVILAAVAWGGFLFIVSPWLMGPNAPRMAVTLHQSCSRLWQQKQNLPPSPTTKQIMVAASVLIAVPSIIDLAPTSKTTITTDDGMQTGPVGKITMRVL